jgi:hypothetical protein
MHVLQFLLLPMRCYHITLEEYFKDPEVMMNCEPCHTKCSYCTGDHPLAKHTFVRVSLIVSFLSTKVFLLGPVPVAHLIKSLGNNKSKVFITPAYKLNQGVVHALVLQLIAAGIVSINIADESKAGTDALSITDFVVNWAIIDGTIDAYLAHTEDKLWSPFNVGSKISLGCTNRIQNAAMHQKRLAQLLVELCLC